ncbi:hypothetical protein H6F90_12145 [Trichocoleus sp. FACHB-591]|uniref:hypothetical protein n=1 Tax=Trichocoleus sp. FACHB-591 TaxID=2692872 RepID=UPI001684D8D0|nr:hypothetical protein [Trichocoleus sp. FACHB-591]MBD2095898.1 hypothetical protein [Trichocoleus sp. FACHB-591]
MVQKNDHSFIYPEGRSQLLLNNALSFNQQSYGIKSVPQRDRSREQLPPLNSHKKTIAPCSTREAIAVWIFTSQLSCIK